MLNRIWILGAVFGLSSCAFVTGFPTSAGGRNPSVVVVDGRGHKNDEHEGRGRGKGKGRGRFGRSPGRIPPGFYPPAGMCRIWYAGTPPGHQPPPARCGALLGRVPYGAFLLYDGSAWDTEYDWHRHAARYPAEVPEVVLRIMVTVKGR